MLYGSSMHSGEELMVFVPLAEPEAFSNPLGCSAPR